MPVFRRASKAKEPSKKDLAKAAKNGVPSPPPSAPATPSTPKNVTPMQQRVASNVTLPSPSSVERLESLVAERENSKSNRSGSPPKPMRRPIEDSPPSAPVKEVVVPTNVAYKKATPPPPAPTPTPAKKSLEKNFDAISELSVTERMSMMHRKESAHLNRTASRLTEEEARAEIEQKAAKARASSVRFETTEDKAKRAAAEEKMKAEAEAARKDAEAKWEAESKVRAAAEAKARTEAEERAAKAKADAEAAAKRSEYANKTEPALLSLHLDKYISEEHASCQSQLADVKAQLKTNEASSALVQEAIRAKREVAAPKFADLNEKIGAYTGSLAVNERFGKQIEALVSEVDLAAGKDGNERDTKVSVRERVQGELGEAKERLEQQTSAVTTLNNELLKFNAGVAPQIAKMGVDLMRMTADAEAKKVNVSFSSKHLDNLKAELTRLETKVADTASIDAKGARADATAALVDGIKERLAADDADLVNRRQQESNVEERGRLEELAFAATRLKLVKDRDAIKGLTALESAILTSELSSVPADATPTQKELQAGTTAVIELGRTKSVKALSHVEVELSDLARAVKTEAEERATELKLLRTERQAIEAAAEQRKLFLVEKERQLEVEKGEVDKARTELCNEQHMIAMLKVEIGLAEKELSTRQQRATDAENARDAKASALRKLKLTSKLRAAAIKVRIAQEAEVQAGQRTYVATLDHRVTTEERLDAKVASVEEARAKGAGLHAEGWLAAARGERGRAFIDENLLAHTKWVGDLKTNREEHESAKTRLEEALATEESTAEAETQLLKEQHTALSHASSKLHDYEARLIAAKPAKEAEPAQKPAVDLDDGLPTIDPTPPCKEVMETPYVAAYKYMASELKRVASEEPHSMQQDLDKISETILSEQNHPLYNPDLKADVGSRSGSWLRSRSGSFMERV